MARHQGQRCLFSPRLPTGALSGLSSGAGTPTPVGTLPATCLMLGELSQEKYLPEESSSPSRDLVGTGQSPSPSGNSVCVEDRVVGQQEANSNHRGFFSLKEMLLIGKRWFDKMEIFGGSLVVC